jgi:hypothetical protein
MTQKELLRQLRKLQKEALLQEQAAISIQQIATDLITKLEGVSTSSSARKGRRSVVSEKDIAEFTERLYRNRLRD